MQIATCEDNIEDCRVFFMLLLKNICPTKTCVSGVASFPSSVDFILRVTFDPPEKSGGSKVTRKKKQRKEGETGKEAINTSTKCGKYTNRITA